MMPAYRRVLLLLAVQAGAQTGHKHNKHKAAPKRTRCECQTPDGLVVPLEPACVQQLTTSSQVPDRDCTVHCPGRQQRTVRAESHRQHETITARRSATRAVTLGLRAWRSAIAGNGSGRRR